jgi:hypothetical protein
MNCIAASKNAVQYFSIFLFLIAAPLVATAQQKPKAAAAPKPAAAPKAAAPRPAQAARPAARPATGATRPANNAARPGAAGAAKPGTTTAARPGGAAGAKTGSTTTAKAGGASAARPGGAAGAKTGGATAGKGGAATGAKASGATGARGGAAAGTKTAAHPPGGTSKVGANGSTHNFNAGGNRTSVETKSGTRANFDRGGHVSTIHTRNGMTINHGAHGERRFESRRRDGGRVVGYGHGRGFAEHGYYRGGRPYMRRTYYSGGRQYAYAYRGSYYRGVAYYGYVPSVYYGPAYYGWAYNPWPAPVAYGWGWGGSPWYGYNSYYFTPAPVYPYPSLWLTDYLLAANLQAAYEAQAAAGALNISPDGFQQPAYGGGGDEGHAGLTPELKQEIAEEVKAQIAAQREAAAHPEPAASASSTAPSGGQNGPDETPTALDPAHRIFIVSQVLSSSTEDGTECSLSPGDVLKRVDDTPDADAKVKVLVASSQKNDCAAASKVPVAVQDLQDMHNDFQAKITEGLGKLAENQGKNGIPSGPAAASKPNPAGQAQPDLTVESDLQTQQAEAGQAEKEVQDASAGSGSDDD